MGKYDISSYLEGDILTKVDRSTMAVALEGREPFLDHKIIEFGVSLPDKYKFRDNQSKWLTRKILASYLPEELTNRPKQGFAIPITDWLKNQFKEELVHIATDDDFCTEFSLNQNELEKIVMDFLNSKSNEVNPQFVWFIYILYQWKNQWL